MGMYEESLRHFLKPIAEYLDDPKVSEIMINGPKEIWIEKGGRLTLTDAKFTAEGLEAAARNMAQFVGRVLNDERPRLDARLPDGSRIHIVMPPIARKGCTIAIRKFFPDKLTVENLVEFGSMSPAMAAFINACVQLKENIIVSGGTGSGKTTMLNCVAAYINDEERILTIEDSAELQMNQEHLVPFESRPPDKFGKGKVDMGDLLQSALRLRPDRIVVGEVRGGEAFHLMQAMNTGHGGSLATVHANTPTDTLRRLESLCLQSGIDLPMVAIRAQVASAINIVISCARLSDGSRRTTHISEVLPLDDRGDYRTQDIFVFTQTHKDENGKIHGYHAPTGLLPTFFDRLKAFGFTEMDEAFFDPATYGVPPPPIFVSEGFKPRWSPSLKHRERGEPDPEVNPVAEKLQQEGKKRRFGVPKAPGRKEGDEAPATKAVEGPAPAPKVPPAEEEDDDLDALLEASEGTPSEPSVVEEEDDDEARLFEEIADDDVIESDDAIDEGDGLDDMIDDALGLEGADEDEALTDPPLGADPPTRVGVPGLPDDALGATEATAPDEDESTDPGAAAIEEEALVDEEGAISAALAEASEEGHSSIELADDFAKEAEAYESTVQKPAPKARPRPAGRKRRRKGGTVGRK